MLTQREMHMASRSIPGKPRPMPKMIITFRVSRRRRETYCGHARLCVCLSVRGRMPTLLHEPGCNLGEW